MDGTGVNESYHEKVSKLEEAAQIISALKDYKKTHRLEYYKPYDYQKRFHNAVGYQDLVSQGDALPDMPAEERYLMCANQIGKTFAGCTEDAFHLTGLYPKWYEGRRFRKPVRLLAAGKTNDSTKNVLQAELFGDPLDEDKLGTGAVPKDCIGKITRKPGVPGALSEILIKHHTDGKFDGWSKCTLLSYEMKASAFMGYKFDVGHGDEEAPHEIWQQFRRSVLSTNGILYMTFTPEEGMTSVVGQVMNDIQPGQALIRAGWDDAPHMTKDRREVVLARFPAHERDMRSKGEPLMGSGRVFDVPEDMIMCDPFEIPPHFARLNGIDIGWAHPAATAFIAVDRDKDCVYVYDGWRASRALIPVHAAATNVHGNWIPVAWPHDGLQHDKQSGKVIADLYRDSGVNMWHAPFTNPPPQGLEEGKGGNGVEAGIFQMVEMMQTGRLKVFSTVKYWWEEARMYHRKDGKIVPIMDDFISAVRIAVMFRRHATTKVVRQPKFNVPRGISNWG